MNITTFDFNGSSVRTEISEGKPMFVANDVAKILGYSNPRKAISDNCKGVTVSDTIKLGGYPAKIIPESDVYRMAMRSRLPAAEDFQDWVCEIVLPSIRSNGGYISKQETDSPEVIMAKALQVANSVIEQHKQKLSKAESEIDRLQGVCNTITAQFAKGMTPPAFCKQLNGINIQQVNNALLKIGALIETKYGKEPASYYRDRYFKVSYKEYEKPDETTGQKATVTLTLAGAKWMYRLYLSSKLPMKKSWDGNFVHVEFKD